MDRLERYYRFKFDLQMRRIKEEAAAAEQQRMLEPPPLSLRERISRWYCDMTWESRCRAYTMRDLATLFATPPNRLGPVLMAMGFQRKRDWSRGQARRYWVHEDCCRNGRTPGKPERR